MRSKPPTVSAPDYEVEHALHVLTEAEKHRRDPKMMERVSKLAAEKKEHLGRVARMKPKPPAKKR